MKHNTVSASKLRRTIAMLPAIGMALLPKLTCPACWAAYAGLLSSMGVGFINYTPYLFPLTALFLVIAVASLGYKAKRRRGYLPFVLGIISTVIIIVGKFIFESDVALYVGIAILMGASLWNSLPKKVSENGSCPACITSKSDLNKEVQTT